jgi:cytochrome c556
MQVERAAAVILWKSRRIIGIPDAAEPAARCLFRSPAEARGDEEAVLRFRLYAAAILVAWSGSMAVAQKVTTPDELDKTMKKVGPAMQAMQKAMKSDNYDEVKAQLAIVKQAMDDSREFWIQHKKEDAIQFNKDTVGKIEALNKVVSAQPVDPSAALAAMKEMGGACLSCHKTYRERDADNNYILKPGSIGG